MSARKQTKAQPRSADAARWAVKHAEAFHLHDLFGTIAHMLADQTGLTGSANETKARIMTLCLDERVRQRKIVDDTLALVARHAQGEPK